MVLVVRLYHRLEYSIISLVFLHALFGVLGNCLRQVVVLIIQLLVTVLSSSCLLVDILCFVLLSHVPVLIVVPSFVLFAKTCIFFLSQLEINCFSFFS